MMTHRESEKALSEIRDAIFNLFGRLMSEAADPFIGATELVNVLRTAKMEERRKAFDILFSAYCQHCGREFETEFPRCYCKPDG